MGNPYTVFPLFIRECMARSIVPANLIVPIIPICLMFRLFNTFTLQLSSVLPFSCLIMSLCVSGKLFSLCLLGQCRRFFANERTTLLCLIKEGETKFWSSKKRQDTKTRAGACVHRRIHNDWTFIFSLRLRASSVCITAVKWTLATKDVHGKTVGERGWGVRFQAQAQSCRHQPQKDFTLD